jgi:hypothetical protein
MPTIKLSVPHKLGASEAKTRISKIVREAQAQFGGVVTDVREEWRDQVGTFGFRAMGFAITGQLDVQPSTVDISINLPLAALPFQTKIEDEMNRQARALLA